MFNFAISELEKHGGVEQFGSALVGALLSLKAVLDARVDLSGDPPRATVQHMRLQMVIHIKMCRMAGISEIPKTHLTLHLIDRQEPHLSAQKCRATEQSASHRLGAHPACVR